MKIWAAFRKAARAAFPWLPRHERTVAIAEARREKERSQAALRHARLIEHQIQQMVSENHYADWVASQIMRGRRGNGA